MKDKIFSVLQRVGRSFMLPIAILPVAGLLLGIGSSFTNATTIATYGLEAFLGDGTLLHSLLTIMSKAGSVIFDNLPIIFAVGVAIGMAKAEKEVAALSAMIAFLVMNVSINAVLQNTGKVLADGSVAEGVLEGTITSVLGIQTLQMGVFGGIIVGLGVAALHNRYHKIVLPNALSFFGGSRFVPIISTITYVFVGILMYFVWPVVQNAIFALGGLVTGTGYVGTLIFGIVKRALIPFGLHHVFYLPFWQTAVGGTMMVDGSLIQGGQNIFFAQLASSNVAHFSADATRYFSGEFIFMIFGLPGAALAMYRCAKPEKKKAAGGLLLSAALTCMLTGITEPIEFSFLFVAPMLFGVQVILAGAAYMIAHMLNIAVGLTFSGGLLDLLIFGILQGNAKTSWMWIVPVGVVYFFLYYFIFSFLIKKFNLKTPGREEEDEETRLYTKADVNAKRTGNGSEAGQVSAAVDQRSADIARFLGGKKNITSVDCCATRLRCSVERPELVDEKGLKATGAVGVIKKGQGVQVIYGPNVTVIKAELEGYLEQAGDESEEVQGAAPGNANRQCGRADGQSVGQANEPGAGAVQEAPQANQPPARHILCSPFNGTAAPITEAPDEAFSSKMMGDGYVVKPSDGQVVMPEDGEVMFVFPSKHAIGLKTADGMEYLLHIGVDTVKLDGTGFEVFVQDGQKVSKGQLLMKFDLDYIRANAASDACMAVFTGLSEGQSVHMERTGQVNALDEIAWYE
ncbi:PTS transporter subunit IIABC [Enterocloster asparagiformis]|uniref:PTS glucose transporter subunit IIA n=2 Tax=Enterocloster asparagiformis TaxID=333367 RepID=A0A413FM40_9FIRM|nr:PTS transporter subunit IIABC [Enterocloster asparagiformis]RGX33270.1 PTS glucose transporter subunit IIA [Enterocloster asparagiformis]UWO79264.1 glucose PTS transporter subunit IIA [[Clostridium] asparagiforme DSM 15981]